MQYVIQYVVTCLRARNPSNYDQIAMIFFFVLILQEYFVGKALLFLALALKHVYKNEQEIQGFSKGHVGFLRVVPFIKF